MSDKEWDELFPQIAGNDTATLFKEAVTKKRIAEFAEPIIEKAENGEIDALDAYVQVKIASEYISNLSKGLKPFAEDEADRYGKEEATMYGCAIQQTSGSTKYDYSHDEVWSEIKAEIYALMAKLKEREDFMKKAMSFSGVVDEDGVEIPPAKAIGGSAASIRVLIPSK